jgi:hypothetical protein
MEHAEFMNSSCPPLAAGKRAPMLCSRGTFSGTTEPEYALNLTVIHQDPAGYKWARELCSRVQQTIGERALRVQAWSVEKLGHVDQWCQAVEAASEADLIFVAVRAKGPMPLDVGTWLDSWLPQRHARPGALVALVSVADQHGFRPFEVQEALRQAAHRNHLDFFLQERLVASEPDGSVGMTFLQTTPKLMRKRFLNDQN